ncbi:MAG: carbohydrate-binding domain-containing protein [Lachnospiraceae bacterium]|nr:carbohydrate-binding domain-containing protein [Lachnospiraceae bacterium]
MSASRHFDKICIVFMIIALLVTAVFMNGESLGITVVVDEDSETHSDDSNFTTNDMDGDWDTTDATVITLDGDDGTVSGSGAYFYDGNLVIASSGTYVVSGELSEGSIIVDANDNSKVWILLDGVTISNSEDACFQVDNADKVFLTLAEGSENYMTSGAEYSSEALADGTGGTIFAHDDLTINGSGSLSIVSEGYYGIDANDDLVITGGDITIEAATDAIHVNDSFRFCEANLVIDAGDDAIHSESYVYIASGTILINTCYEGIEGVQIDIAGGDITIYPSDDGINANGGSSDFGQMQMGDFSPMDNMTEAGNMDNISDDANTNTTDSVNNEGDVNGNNDDNNTDLGESDTTESVTPPSMDDGSSETTEMTDAISEPAYDESAANTDNTDDSSASDEEEESTYVSIMGGTITIINESGMDADGIDSNGDIIISGGTVYVSLSGSGSNTALDYGSESGGILQINGGTVIAAGGSSMLEEVDESSSQATITYTLDNTEDNTTLSLLNSNGERIVEYTVPVCFSAVIISSPLLEDDGTYTIVIGDTQEEITLEDGSYTNSSGSMMTMGGGEMGGGRMGGGQMNGTFDSSTSETTDATTQTEISESGEMPEMPDMAENGEAPDMSEMAENGEAPDMSQNGDMPQGGFDQQETTSEDTESDSSTATSVLEASTEYWVMLISSFAAVIVGLVVAITFKRRKR